MSEVNIKKKENNSSINLYYSKKNELEIIKKYQDLIMYVYLLIKKYPENEKMNLTYDTKKILNEGLEMLVFAKRVYTKNDKLKYLFFADAKLNVLKILVRISKRSKFITAKNYTAWSYKIVEIDQILEKWIQYCQR